MGAVYLDLSKAFDVVNIALLLYKLVKIGIRGPPFLWIKAYLPT